MPIGSSLPNRRDPFLREIHGTFHQTAGLLDERLEELLGRDAMRPGLGNQSIALVGDLGKGDRIERTIRELLRESFEQAIGFRSDAGDPRFDFIRGQGRCFELGRPRSSCREMPGRCLVHQVRHCFIELLALDFSEHSLHRRPLQRRLVSDGQGLGER